MFILSVIFMVGGDQCPEETIWQSLKKLDVDVE